MKKFYVLAAAAAVAMSAAAQDKIYVVGDGEGLAWGTAGQMEIEKADGVFKFDIKNLVAFKMSTVKMPVIETEDPETHEVTTSDDWSTFETGVYGCSYGFQINVEKELVKGFNTNIAAPWKGDYTVTIAGDLSTVKLETSTPQPGGGYSVYFRGNMNDWGNVPADLPTDTPADENPNLVPWKFTCIDTENLIFKFTFADDQLIEPDKGFKLADANWGSINFGMPQEEVDGTMQDLSFIPVEEAVALRANGSDIIVKEEVYGVAYFNLPTGELFLSNDADAANPFGQGAVNDITVENNSEAAYYTLQGVRVAEPANGLYIVVKDGKATKVIR